jgi:membrane protein YdbS with pleckstrin-like domain
LARLPQSHPGIPPELDRYLTTAEKIVFRTRLHWIRIAGPWLQFFLALLVLAILDSKLPRNTRARDILVFLLLLILARALWRTFEWYREWFVGTDRRLMLTLGIITRKVAMIPLSKVTDMRYDRPPIGQVLGYGSFILESAGQDQAFREVEYVPHPDLLYRRISEELFTPSATRALDRPAPGPKALPVQEPTAPWWKRTP